MTFILAPLGGHVELTLEALARFAGGQVEIYHFNEGHLCRGEIARITIINNELRISLVWLAQGGGVGFPPYPSTWTKIEPRDIIADLSLYTVVSDDICIRLESHVQTDRTMALFPPTGSRLDPVKIEGLTIPVFVEFIESGKIQRRHCFAGANLAEILADTDNGTHFGGWRYGSFRQITEQEARALKPKYFKFGRIAILQETSKNYYLGLSSPSE